MRPKGYVPPKHVPKLEWLLEQKSNPCERCGRTYHHVAMQFDHLPGFQKVCELNRGTVHRLSWTVILAEREKCQLLCANCHHITTWERAMNERVPLD